MWDEMLMVLLTVGNLAVRSDELVSRRETTWVHSWAVCLVFLQVYRTVLKLVDRKVSVMVMLMDARMDADLVVQTALLMDS
jgi:hypothetical protein